MKNQMHCDHIFKLIVVGNSCVGKTSLLKRFSDDEYTDNHATTIGVDFRVRTMEIKGKTVKLQMWDTAGQERFSDIVSNYFRGAHGIMYIFSLTDPASLKSIKDQWIPRAQQHGILKRILIGNKCDLIGDRKVTPEDVSALISSLSDDQEQMEYLETSAKENIKVCDAFTQLATALVEYGETNMIPSTRTTVVFEGKDPFALEEEPNKRSGCCK